MKIAYAFRRCTFYPNQEAELPLESAARRTFLKKVKSLGFDGVELSAAVPEISGSREEAIQTLRGELEGAWLACAAVRSRGGLTDPRSAAGNKKGLENAVRFAAQIGAGILNTPVSTGRAYPPGKGADKGETISHGASRTASEEDFERTANGIAEIARLAADVGIEISIEVHQQSIVDNSWSALHMLELINQPNVGINPDLGNIYWTYHIPEESSEDAIVALAPYAKYWHCKNLYRFYIPDIERSLFMKVPLSDGDIDYRFAISAMLAAEYDGYLAVEGVRAGDQFDLDGRSVTYVKSLLAELGA
jgi:sugar phosphate isomerase/epimerase